MGLGPFDKLRATTSQVSQVLQRIPSLFHVTWHPRRGTIPMGTWQSWLRASPRGPVATGTWLTGGLGRLDSLIV
jgi:hypothetical protein